MIAIIDLGLGNLYSVSRALQHVGADCIITNQADEIKKAEKIILPGVGSYKAGMESIFSKNLDDTIKGLTSDGFPILGICLGMQLLMDCSEENGVYEGLGLVSGKVQYFQNLTDFNSKVKVPNISWCSLKHSAKVWDGSILDGIKEESDCYFVHSLCVVPDNSSDILAISNYGGTEFTSVIERKNIFGCQFHPEKSAEIGLDIIKNFINYKA